jgi:hypothetical protein
MCCCEGCCSLLCALCRRHARLLRAPLKYASQDGLTHSLILSLPLSLSLSYLLSLTFSLSLSHTDPLTFSVSPSPLSLSPPSLSLSHTHARKHAVTHTGAQELGRLQGWAAALSDGRDPAQSAPGGSGGWAAAGAGAGEGAG